MTYLAIGAVTKSVAELLFRKLNKPPLLGSVTLRVSSLPPDDARVDTADGVNLFLYRVAESPFASNVEWPGDRTGQGAAKRPPLALTLHYLLTAYTNKSNTTAQDDITAHQILGNAMAILHDYPVLNDIHDGDFDADVDEHFAPELREAYEKIKISRSPITMEEYSKIWTGLGKAYRLSAAYEVSMVQIAPFAPGAMPGPPNQGLTVKAAASAAPRIIAVQPAEGPAGGTVTLRGKGFTCRGSSTSVAVGDTMISEADLLDLSDTEITFALPVVLSRGPRVPIRVAAGGQQSRPVLYEVQPWIRTIQPLRGATGIPISISCSVPEGATVSAEIDGQAVSATLDTDRQSLRAVVPASISSNGPKSVVAIVDNGSPQRSNMFFYEVLPSLQSKSVTTIATPEKTTVSVTGLRLSGKDVHVRYGELFLTKGENTSPTQISIDVPRLLPTDQAVSVIIDGRDSNPLPPRLDRIEPAKTYGGDAVTLTGRGLSGQNVSVSFGALSLPLGAQAFSSRILVTVPAALTPGNIQVKVVVDGNETNSLPFEVIP